jgi:hypothetical protein
MQYRDKVTFLKVNIMTPENHSRGDIQCQAVAGNSIVYAVHAKVTYGPTRPGQSVVLS